MRMCAVAIFARPRVVVADQRAYRVQDGGSDLGTHRDGGSVLGIGGGKRQGWSGEHGALVASVEAAGVIRRG